MNEPTFKATAEVRILVTLELSGESSTGDIAKMRAGVEASATKSVEEAVEKWMADNEWSWSKKVDAVEAETVKLTIDWERSES